MKCSFSQDPGLSKRLFDLLEVVFPGLGEVAQNARDLGPSWESVSTPFISFQEDRAVSHVGVIELSLVLMGSVAKVGSIHGVATHPDHRKRGYYRSVMEEALHYADARYKTLILTTEHPEYFEPFGFRFVREHMFAVKCDPPVGGGRLRLINTQEPEDVALVQRLLETREPVSNVVGVVNEQAVFGVNEGSRPLHYAPDIDAVLCMEIEGTRLKLFDIVTSRLPQLRSLVELAPKWTDEIEIYFSPDRISVEAEAHPYILDHDGPSYLMVRGPFTPEGEAFTLPRSART
jgi:GNAT superfamily N-acetyltransferase